MGRKFIGEKRVNFQFSLNPDIMKLVKSRAALLGLTMREAVVKALDEWLEKNDTERKS